MDLIVFSEAKYFYTLVTSSFQTPIVGYVKQISDFLESFKFPIDRWCDRSSLKSYACLNNFTSYRYEYFLYYACANPHIEGFNEYKAKLKSMYPSIMDIKSELLKTVYTLEYSHLLDKEIQKGFNQVNF